MTVLRSPPYSLQYAELVSAKLRARNAINWSEYSPSNAAGALVETEPKQTATPTPTSGTSTDHRRLHVQWSAITSAADTGGSPITTYILEWDAGLPSNGFVALVGSLASPYLGTSYLLDSGVTAGTTYQFRLKAVNQWGTGGPGGAV